MKKMRCCFLILFASFILAVQLYGQDSQSDSIKLNSDSAKNELKLSSDIVKKLDNKDIVEIIKYREKLALEKEMANDIANPPSKGMVEESTVTIWSILFVLFILFLFVIPFYFNLKKAKTRQQIITKLIEKDRDIPNELLAKSPKTKRSDLHKGIVLIAIGLSLCIVIFILRIHSNFWTIGLIPMFLGIAYLISFKLDHSFVSKSEID